MAGLLLVSAILSATQTAHVSHVAAHDVRIAAKERRQRELPLFPSDVPSRLRQPTKLSVLHSPVSLKPFPSLQQIDDSFLRLSENETSAASFRYERQSQWIDAAARPTMPIVILGTSCTGGAGAAEGISNSGLLAKSKMEGSWGRHFVDFLNRHLVQNDLLPAQNVGIFYKNAASPLRFGFCAESFVPNTARLVIVETVTKLLSLSTLDHQLGFLAALRRAAPKAALLFVQWPGKDYMQAIAASSTQRRMAAHISTAATAQRVQSDFLCADSVLNHLRRPCSATDNSTGSTASSQPCYLNLYADGVHPNPSGHQLLGALVARHVARSIISAARLVGSTSHFAAPGPLRAVENATAGLQLCYPSVRSLPVASNQSIGDWRLVDEGASKGVEKLGFLSAKLNDVLSLDLTRDLPKRLRAGCGLLLVSLDYLLSTTIPTQGAMRLSCTGCNCSELSSYWASVVNPFPLVETNGNFGHRPEHRGSNLSITAQTSFIALHSNATACYLHIRHVPSAATRAHRTVRTVNISSRIRVDGLFLQPFESGGVSRYLVPSRAKTSAGILARQAKAMGCIT